MKRIILYLFACACVFTACVSYETITDTFYVSNETGSEVSLVLSRSAVWDTCATTDLKRVWFDTNTITISAGKTVRLHPIRREFVSKNANTQWNIVNAVGATVRLVVGGDTISWHAQKNGKRDVMFVADTPWSIYNKECWDSSKDKDQPNTYHHRFVITSENIERSKP